MTLHMISLYKTPECGIVMSKWRLWITDRPTSTISRTLLFHQYSVAGISAWVNRAYGALLVTGSPYEADLTLPWLTKRIMGIKDNIARGCRALFSGWCSPLWLPWQNKGEGAIREVNRGVVRRGSGAQ